MLPNLGNEMIVVGTRRVFKKGEPAPAVKFPAGAVLIPLKNAKQLGPKLQIAFNNLVAIINLQAGMMGYSFLTMAKEYKGIRILEASYMDATKGEMEGKKSLPARFNLKPACATVGNHFVLASHTDILKQVIDGYGKGGKAVEGVNAGVWLKPREIHAILAENREPLVAQAMVNDGLGRAEAEGRIDFLLDLAKYVHSFAFTSRDHRGTLGAAPRDRPRDPVEGGAMQDALKPGSRRRPTPGTSTRPLHLARRAGFAGRRDAIAVQLNWTPSKVVAAYVDGPGKDPATADLDRILEVTLGTNNADSARAWLLARMRATRYRCARRWRCSGTATSRRRSPELLPWLMERSGGNPLFLKHTLELLLRRDLLRSGEDGSLLVAPEFAEPIPLPTTLLQMVQEQVAKLEPVELQRVLEVASVAGQEFDSGALGEALGETESFVEEACDELCTRDWLAFTATVAWPDETRHSRFRFGHALFADAIYESIPPARRARIHYALAERLLAGHGDSESIAGEVAVHFERGGDPRHAAPLRARAARAANARFAAKEAEQHASEGLARIEHLRGAERLRVEVDLRLAIAEALGTLEGYASPRTGTNWETARGLAAQLGDARREQDAMSGYILHLAMCGNAERAGEVAGELLILAERSGDPLDLRVAHHSLTMVSYFQGRFADCLGHARSACADLEEIPADESQDWRGHDIAANAATYEALALWQLGRDEEARPTTRSCWRSSTTSADSSASWASGANGSAARSRPTTRRLRTSASASRRWSKWPGASRTATSRASRRRTSPSCSAATRPARWS